MDLTRTIVIGNSGSGKSWLAEQIAKQLDAPWLDLDLIHWEPGGYKIARNREAATTLIKDAAISNSWVIEGVYGWLVNEIESKATALVWICVDEAECIANIRHRGVRGGGSDESFNSLLNWARSYRSREDSSSCSAHKRIFENFSGTKTCLSSKREVTAFTNFALLR